MNQVAPTILRRGGQESVPGQSSLDVRRQWGASIAAAVASLIAICLLDLDSVLRAVSVWENSKTYNHGFLVLPISLYLLWDRRMFVSGFVPQPLFAALLLTVPLAVLWLVGRMISLLEAQQFALVGLMQVALLTIFGWRIFLRLSFPFLYLLFLVPTGDYLVPPLQDITAVFAVTMLKLFGVPVYSDGIIIEVPAGTFVVAEACAGLRFLIASIAYGVLFAGLIYRSWYRRVLFVAASILVPILANGLRAFGLVYAAQLLDSQAAVDADHIIYGWGFFAFVTLILTVVGLRFRESETVPPPGNGPVRAAAPWKPVLAGFLVTVAAAAAPAFAAWDDAEAERLGQVALTGIDVPGWTRVPADETWKPKYPGASGESFSGYSGSEGVLQAYIGYYPRQTQSRKLVGSLNRLADVDDWRRTGSGGRTIDVGGEKAPISYQRLASGRTNRVVWTWYWINDRFVSGGVTAKLEQLKAEFFGGRRAAAVVILSAGYSDRPEEAERILAAFAADLSTLKPALRQADPAGPR